MENDLANINKDEKTTEIMQNSNTKEIKRKERILEFFKGLGTIILFYIVANFTAQMLKPFNSSNNMVIATISQIATYLIILLVLGLIYHKRLINDFKNFKKEYFTVAIKNWLLGLIVMVIANLIITSIIGNLPANESANRELLNAYPVSNTIIMILIGPMVEEITFRASFKKAFKSIYPYAITTGLLFGLAHIAEPNLLELLFIIPYGALGFFFAKALYETDNIYTSYIAHFLHNTMCIFLIILM